MVLFLFGMLSSYVASAVYHATPEQHTRKNPLRKIDHAAIYWHIAGSYSPILLVALRDEGWWGWGLFIFIWTAALAGSTTSFIHLSKHSHIETVSFCLMGLSILVAIKPLMHHVDGNVILWIILEGCCSITGAVFYSIYKKRYMHTVFHCFIVGGTVCHLIALWYLFAQYLAT